MSRTLRPRSGYRFESGDANGPANVQNLAKQTPFFSQFFPAGGQKSVLKVRKRDGGAKGLQKQLMAMIKEKYPGLFEAPRRRLIGKQAMTPLASPAKRPASVLKRPSAFQSRRAQKVAEMSSVQYIPMWYSRGRVAVRVLNGPQLGSAQSSNKVLAMKAASVVCSLLSKGKLEHPLVSKKLKELLK